ncbi:hypothetical protein Q4577_22880 [Marinovum sp. 2_MG-2023]|uniref:hypothetical protein n=1 Tax=unclassified Marinovum TaxID=2647166 RepID=UPI0026E2F58E|nr:MULTISPECIES: hypothetical protein [unclassified Marinovum]MDO6732863.1 hypothetical protein [Marinovum sp. 2_MG-2023]MDO6782141.1 hypothetical protein [Marinovum sp. 1_MG-2023]
MNNEIIQFGGGRVGLDAYEVYSAVETDAGRTPLSREEWVAQWQDATAQKEAAETAQTAAETAKTEAEAAQAAAETARDNAQAKARTTALWTDLFAISGSVDREGAEVLDSDTGTHLDATATGYDGPVVPNGGGYSWIDAWSRWSRTGDTFASSKADKTSLETEIAARATGDAEAAAAVAAEAVARRETDRAVAELAAPMGQRDSFGHGIWLPFYDQSGAVSTAILRDGFGVTKLVDLWQYFDREGPSDYLFPFHDDDGNVSFSPLRSGGVYARRFEVPVSDSASREGPHGITPIAYDSDGNIAVGVTAEGYAYTHDAYLCDVHTYASRDRRAELIGAVQ